MLQQKFTHGPRNSLRHSVNVHITQLMKMMTLSTSELEQYVESIVSVNPALEFSPETRCPSCNRRLSREGICLACSAKNSADDSVIIFTTPRHDFTSYSATRDDDDSPPAEETLLYQEHIELKDYVYEQISPDLADDEKPIAYHLLCNVLEDGLLGSTVEEIARYYFVSPEVVNSIREKIKHADPPGVASLTAQEAMLVQLDVLEELDSAAHELIPLARKALGEGYDLFLHMNTRKLARFLKIDDSEVEDLISFIAVNLYPYPGQTAWGRFKANKTRNSEQFYSPDIVISSNSGANSALKIEILMPSWGTVQVNPLFKEALNNAPDEKLEKWKSDLEDATLLAKCIKNRYQTIVLLMKVISRIQKEFILKGDAYLEPITRAALANEIGVHESTISRAVSSKKVQLPNGKIIELSAFFDRSLPARTALKNLVENEEKPLSDRQLANELAKLGFPIKRRTVAKYRNYEKILPARLRKNYSTGIETA